MNRKVALKKNLGLNLHPESLCFYQLEYFLNYLRELSREIRS